jgi:hypothetical protein
MTIKFEVNGMTIVVDDAEERLQVLREIAQIQLETESATPSTPTSPVPEDDGLKLPDGYKTRKALLPTAKSKPMAKRPT